ncbi:MAG: LytR family transcriptional regulator, partial [Salinibacterium sp.]
WIEPGVQKMNGYTALWYARSRHGTSDYDRMKRQRDVQAAVLEQFQPSVVLLRFQSVAEAGSRIVKTDISQRMLGQFVELAGKARNHELNRVELVPPLVNVVYPDFADIHAIVQENTVVSEGN